MARLAFTLTVLCFFFAFAYARTPFDFPENDVTYMDLTKSVPEWTAKPSLLLPTEKIESEPTAVVESESVPVNTETNVLNVDPENKAVGTAVGTVIADDLTVDSVPLERPLTIGGFHQVNRHFPSGRRPYRFLFPHSNCRHGMRHMINPRVHGREMSYGNDMILATDSKDSDHEMFRGVERQIPAQWMSFHHHEDGDDLATESKDSDHEMFRGGERQIPTQMSFHHGVVMTTQRKDSDHEMFRGGERQIPAQWMNFHHHHHEDGDDMATESKDSDHEIFRGGKHQIHPQWTRFEFDHHEDGNEMATESKDSDNEMFRGGEHHFPQWMMRFHHHRRHHHEGMPRFPFSMHHKQKFRKHFRDEEESEKKKDREDREEEDDDEKEGGFMTRIRKFFDF